MLDEIFDFFSDIPDLIVELPSVIGEFIGSMFENMGELSYTGLAFGFLSVGFIFFFRERMLNPFLVHMGAIEAVFWMFATYMGCGLAGYLIGKHFDNT